MISFKYWVWSLKKKWKKAWKPTLVFSDHLRKRLHLCSCDLPLNSKVEKGKPLYGDAGRPTAGLEPAVRSVCYITAQICVKSRGCSCVCTPWRLCLSKRPVGGASEKCCPIQDTRFQSGLLCNAYFGGKRITLRLYQSPLLRLPACLLSASPAVIP